MHKNITIQPGTLWIGATQHTNGDGDFDGHGPNMYFNANLYVANEYQLGLNCFVRFEETTSDWTTWQGSFTGIVFDIRNQGGNAKIASVITPPFNVTTTLSGYKTQTLPYGSGGIVQTIDASGDSDGGWFGGDDQPGVSVVFNNITIDVVEPPMSPNSPDFLKWYRTKIPIIIHFPIPHHP